MGSVGRNNEVLLRLTGVPGRLFLHHRILSRDQRIYRSLYLRFLTWSIWSQLCRHNHSLWKRRWTTRFLQGVGAPKWNRKKVLDFLLESSSRLPKHFSSRGRFQLIVIWSMDWTYWIGLTGKVDQMVIPTRHMLGNRLVSRDLSHLSILILGLR